MKYATTIITALLLSCNSSKKSIEPSSSLYNNDCYQERTVEYTFTNQKATVIKVTDRFLLSTEESKRYLPCEIPTQYQVEGTAVLFSGQQMSISPNERIIGTPLQLTKLSLDNQ